MTNQASFETHQETITNELESLKKTQSQHTDENKIIKKNLSNHNAAIKAMARNIEEIDQVEFKKQQERTIRIIKDLKARITEDIKTIRDREAICIGMIEAVVKK